MALFVTIIIGVVIALISSFLYFSYRPKGWGRVEHLSGPPLTPILGAIPLIYHLDNKNGSPTCLTDWRNHIPAGLTRCILNWIKIYGSPIKVKGLWQFAVAISSCENVEAILRSTKNIKKGLAYNFLHAWMGEGLLTSTGSKWQKQRRYLTPAFHFDILQQYVPIFNEHARELTKWFAGRCKDSERGTVLDIRKPITLAALDMICETSMGKQLHSLESGSNDYANAIIEFGDSLVYRYTKPWLHTDFIYYNFSSVGRQVSKAITLMKNFTNNVIDEKEAHMIEQQNKGSMSTLEENSATESADQFVSYRKKRLSLIDLLLQLKANGEITREKVREQVDTFMFEGHDTTATGIMWVLYCIAKEPGHQKVLCDEIDGVIGMERSGHHALEVTPDDVGKMSYLDRCIKEGQRLFPSVPVVIRSIVEDLKIGQKFALLEMKIVICHILLNFTLECDQTVDEIQPIMAMVLRPSNALEIKFKPRYRVTEL